MLFLYSCAHLANSHWLWGWFFGQRNSRIFSGSASCSIVLHSAPQCMAGLRSSLLFLIHHFCLHTEVLEEEVVSQPDTFYLLFCSDNNGFGQNSYEERTLSGKETSQSAGVGRSLRVRGQTSVSGVCILGDRRLSAGIKQHNCWHSWSYDNLAEDVFKGLWFYTDRLLPHLDNKTAVLSSIARNGKILLNK